MHLQLVLFSIFALLISILHQYYALGSPQLYVISEQGYHQTKQVTFYDLLLFHFYQFLKNQHVDLGKEVTIITVEHVILLKVIVENSTSYYYNRKSYLLNFDQNFIYKFDYYRILNFGYNQNQPHNICSNQCLFIIIINSMVKFVLFKLVLLNQLFLQDLIFFIDFKSIQVCNSNIYFLVELHSLLFFMTNFNKLYYSTYINSQDNFK